MLLLHFFFVTLFCNLIWGFQPVYVAEVLHHYDGNCEKILDEFTIRARNSEDVKLRNEELKKYKKDSAEFHEMFDNVVYLFSKNEDESCYKYKKYLYGERHDNPECANSNVNASDTENQPWPVPAPKTHITLVPPLKITVDNLVYDIQLEE